MHLQTVTNVQKKNVEISFVSFMPMFWFSFYPLEDAPTKGFHATGLKLWEIFKALNTHTLSQIILASLATFNYTVIYDFCCLLQWETGSDATTNTQCIYI